MAAICTPHRPVRPKRAPSRPGAGAPSPHCTRRRTCRASCGGAAASSGMRGSQLLEALQAEPLFAQQLTECPAFAETVRTHALLHDAVCVQAPLQAARTRVSDAQGVFLRHTKDAAGPFGKAVLRTQTLSSPVAPVDWAHHTFAAAPGFCYSKSSVFTADDCLTPHLELEMAAGKPGQPLLLYVHMDPRLSLTMHPHYLKRYYTSPPPGGSRSWAELEASVSGLPGFSRFTSPSLDVRVFSAGSILFNVASDEAGAAAARQVVQDAAAIWLAWLADGGANSARSADAVAAAAGPAAVPANAAAQQQLLGELAARSAAWRRFPRREKAAAFMQAAFGAAEAEDYWDSMAGDARLRLDGGDGGGTSA